MKVKKRSEEKDSEAGEGGGRERNRNKPDSPSWRRQTDRQVWEGVWRIGGVCALLENQITTLLKFFSRSAGDAEPSADV